nr:MAG TPA: Cro [Caudoviricetes sp.]
MPSGCIASFTVKPDGSVIGEEVRPFPSNKKNK